MFGFVAASGVVHKQTPPPDIILRSYAARRQSPSPGSGPSAPRAPTMPLAQRSERPSSPPRETSFSTTWWTPLVWRFPCFPLRHNNSRANGTATWTFETTCETILAAGAWSSTSASRMITLGAVATLSRKGCRRSKDLDAPLLLATSKVNNHRHQNADNQNISFLPAIVSTSTRMHGVFLHLLFLQAHRETEAHFTATGMPSHRNNSDMLRFRRAAFYQSLKSKVGLAAAKAAALRINLNIEACGVVATAPNARSLSRCPSSPPPPLTQSPPRSLVRDGQTSPHKPRLVVSHSTCPPLSPGWTSNLKLLGEARALKLKQHTFDSE